MWRRSPAPVEMTGNPEAMASRTTLGVPSLAARCTKMSAAAYSSRHVVQTARELHPVRQEPKTLGLATQIGRKRTFAHYHPPKRGSTVSGLGERLQKEVDALVLVQTARPSGPSWRASGPSGPAGCGSSSWGISTRLGTYCTSVFGESCGVICAMASWELAVMYLTMDSTGRL